MWLFPQPSSPPVPSCLYLHLPACLFTLLATGLSSVISGLCNCCCFCTCWTCCTCCTASHVAPVAHVAPAAHVALPNCFAPPASASNFGSPVSQKSLQKHRSCLSQATLFLPVSPFTAIPGRMPQQSFNHVLDLMTLKTQATKRLDICDRPQLVLGDLCENNKCQKTKQFSHRPPNSKFNFSPMSFLDPPPLPPLFF